MNTLNRYLFREFLVGSAGLLVVASCVMFLVQSIQIVDTVAEHGKGFRLFAELASLLAPPILAQALPVTGFVGTLLAAYRLYEDSEIAAAYSAGVGPWQLIPAVAGFALVVALLSAAVTLYLSPLSARGTQDRLIQLRDDLGTRLLHEGRFLTPAPGMTVYIRRLDRQQVMHDVFVHDAADPDAVTSYVAQEAQLHWGLRPELVMLNGSAHTVDARGEQVGLLRFDRLVYDLSELLRGGEARPPRPHELFVTELLDPEARARDAAQRSRYAVEGHNQLSAPLYALALPFVAIAGLFAGSPRPAISSRRLLVAAAAGVLLLVGSFAAKAAAAGDPGRAWLFYLPPLIALALSLGGLARSGRHSMAVAR